MTQSPMHASRFSAFDFRVAPLLVLVGTLASLWPVLRNIGGVEFIGLGDPWRYAGPVLFYGDYWLHHGELPLWNPLVNCGQPFAANPQSFLFYPPNLLRSLLTFGPTPYRTHVGILILVIVQMAVGGYGAYLFARAHGFGRGPALAAAFAFGLSGGAVSRVVAHWYFHNAIMWLPFLFWATRNSLLAIDLRRQLMWASVAGILYGMVLLAGTPLFMVFLGLFVAAYVLLHRCVFHPWRASGSASRFLRCVAGDVAGLSVLLGIGVLVASPLLLPALEFSSFSSRGGADPSNVELHGEGMFEWNLWEILCIYPGDERYEAFRGAGAGIMLLALVGLLSPRKKELFLYGGLFLFALDCAREEPLVFGQALAQLAPYKVSSPGRIGLPMCLPLGMLAAMGVEAIVATGKSLTTKMMLTAMTVLASAVVLITVWATVPPHPLFVFNFTPLIIPAVLAIGAVAAIWIRNWRNAGVYLALTTLLEIVVWNQFYIAHFAIKNTANLYPGTIEQLQGPRSMWNDNFRSTHKYVNVHMYDLDPAVNGYDPLSITEAVSTITENPPSVFDRVTYQDWVAKNQHFGFLKRAFWLSRQYVVGELPASNRPYPYTTTVFLREPLPPPYVQVDRAELPIRAFSDNATSIDLLDGPPVYLNQEMSEDVDDESFVVLAEDLDTTRHSVLGVSTFAKRRATLRLFLVDQANEENAFPIMPLSVAPYPQYPKRPYREYPLPDFERARLIARGGPAVEPSAFIQEIKLYQDDADESRFIQIDDRTANTVRLTVGPLTEPRILLFVDAYYPGWKAYVDGNRVSIKKANNAFKAITLSPGTHDVRFVFSSWRVWVGIVVSLTTLVILAMVYWRERNAS